MKQTALGHKYTYKHDVCVCMQKLVKTEARLGLGQARAAREGPWQGWADESAH